MKNLIRALNYQIRRDNVTYYAYLAGIAALILLFITDVSGSAFELTGSEYFFSSMAGANSASILFFFSILVTRICGWDYSDKTINYQIFAGHSRDSVFWSRIRVSFLTCVPSAVLIFFILPPVILSLKNGWGISMDIDGVLLRCFICLFIILRIYSECVLFTFITKSCYTGLITSFLYLYIGATIFSMLSGDNHEKTSMISVCSSLLNYTEVMNFNDYDFKYIDGVDEIVADSAIEPSYALVTIIVSLLVSAASVLVSWYNFRRADMK